jgi:hypothetical protein
MKNLLVRDNHRSGIAQRLAAAGVPRISRMSAARDDQPKPVSGFETIRRGPELYFHLARIACLAGRT